MSALSLLAELDRLEATLAGVASDDADRVRVTERLRGLMAGWHDDASEGTDAGRSLEEATADELFDLLDDELESS
ncbi:hypothetical protein [Streptomyces sp. NRRL WC-3549]|uniref:hypothetical protein n=1 Tax=Streptomyces sp. NRRL WC-3549 TaxID=1463925 RepID=UPI0004C9901D|nr:hypothetical protein [Streptomyces sp. NRRL WC-3549]